MSHPQQMNFVSSVKTKYTKYFTRTQVLEIGSLNINGSVRTFFENCNYIGVDVGAGPGVDVVARGEDLRYSDQLFDVTISTECFEHTAAWYEIFLNMIRMTKSQGLVVFTCASDGRAEHGTTRTTPNDAPFLKTDYYRNLNESDFVSKMNFLDVFDQWQFSVNEQSHDLYFYGIKK
jgi:hypothetical protein